MLLALATLCACWRPAPYEPPAAPVSAALAAAEAPDADPPDGAPGGGRDAPPEEGAPEGDEGDEGDAPPAGAADPEDVPRTDAFDPYPARTVLAPATIVDDFGKPLAVLGSAGWALEVRGEEPIRVRVFCAACSPAVEGWLQPQVIERLPR